MKNNGAGNGGDKTTVSLFFGLKGETRSLGNLGLKDELFGR